MSENESNIIQLIIEVHHNKMKIRKYRNTQEGVCTKHMSNTQRYSAKEKKMNCSGSIQSNGNGSVSQLDNEHYAKWTSEECKHKQFFLKMVVKSGCDGFVCVIFFRPKKEFGKLESAS